MSDKKNIDRLFQEQFKDFEPQVPVAAWDAIESQLDQKKSRRVIPLWMLWARTAAGIALLSSIFYTGYQFALSNQNNNRTDQIVTQENEWDEDSGNTQQVIKSLSDSQHKTIVNQNGSETSHQNIPSTNQQQTTPQHLSKPRLVSIIDAGRTKPDQPEQNDTSPSTVRIASQVELQEQGVTIEKDQPYRPLGKIPKLKDVKPTVNEVVMAADSVLKSQNTLTAIAQASNENDQEVEKENTSFSPSWSATTMFAPVYSSASGSAINDNFADNQKTAGLNLSYGVAVGYQVTPKLSVRTGLHRVDMSYTTNDIIYGVQVQAGNSGVTTLSYNPSNVHSANTPMNPVDIGSSFSQEFLIDNTFSGFQGEISQRLGYIEVPLEVRYQLIDKKVGIHAIGGLSALFLTENSIAVTDNTARLDLGADDNFNTFNQSANVGFGLDYHFNKSIGLNIEPMFKYQLNPLRDNNANFRPYNIAIYSGITYRF